MKRAFKELTKQYVKDAYALIDAAAAAAAVEKGSEEEDVEEKEVVVPAAAVAPTGQNWTCAGRLWDAPPTACPGGEKSTQKAGILHAGTRVVVCKECFNARERKKNQEKRDMKRAKIQSAIKE
jgi:hypothetical protein